MEEAMNKQFNELLDETLEIMEKTGEREPCAIDAVNQLCDRYDISDSMRNDLEWRAFFEWSDYIAGAA